MMTMTMRKHNSPIRRVQARAVDFVQSPLGVGGATFAGIGLIDLIGHLGPNGLLVASLAGIVTYSFKDEILIGLSKATGRTIGSPDAEQERRPRDEDEDEGVKPPPQVYHYEEIKHLIPASRMLLGVHPESGKLELTKWVNLKCLWIVGTSSTGKSNTAYGKAHQAVSAGALLLVVDQHINKPDSLGKKLLAFEEAFLRPIAVTDEEVLATLDFYENEFNRRVAGGKWSRKIVLICDEMNRMARNPRLLPRLKEIVAICGEESRGFGMYGWFLSQKAVHLKWLRDSAITVIANRMTRIEEARLACNDDLKAARKNLHFPVGRSFVYGVDFEEMELQQEWYQLPDAQDEDDEDYDEEYELEDDDDPLSDVPMNKDQAESQDLDGQTVVSWYKQDLIDQETLLDLMQHIRSKGKGKAPRVVDAEVNPAPSEVESQPVQKKLPKDLQRALDICKEQGIKGPRALHREMGGSYYEAQKLYAELVERGLVEAD
jgi:hypothetical protein